MSGLVRTNAPDDPPLRKHLNFSTNCTTRSTSNHCQCIISDSTIRINCLNNSIGKVKWQQRIIYSVTYSAIYSATCVHPSFQRSYCHSFRLIYLKCLMNRQDDRHKGTGFGVVKRWRRRAILPHCTHDFSNPRISSFGKVKFLQKFSDTAVAIEPTADVLSAPVVDVVCECANRMENLFRIPVLLVFYPRTLHPALMNQVIYVQWQCHFKTFTFITRHDPNAAATTHHLTLLCANSTAGKPRG